MGKGWGWVVGGREGWREGVGWRRKRRRLGRRCWGVGCKSGEKAVKGDGRARDHGNG